MSHFTFCFWEIKTQSREVSFETWKTQNKQIFIQILIYDFIPRKNFFALILHSYIDKSANR